MSAPQQMTDSLVAPVLGKTADSAVQEEGVKRTDGIAEDPEIKDRLSLEEDGGSSAQSEAGTIEEKSKGVLEMEFLTGRLSRTVLVILYATFMLLSYSLSLNQYTSSAYLTFAVSESFEAHSLQSTISTVGAVFQAMAQPPIAKLADYFGRVKTYIGCVIFYCIGLIIVASSQNIVAYAVGNTIYIVGITGLFLLQNVIIGDISSLKNRYWWSQFPSIPGAINAFVSANVVASLMAHGPADKQWRWGFAMFIILTPALALPIITTLWVNTRPTRMARADAKAAKASRAPQSRAARFSHQAKSFFWQLDFIGLILFVIGFGLFFVTITLANSKTAKWSDAHSIAQLIVGAVFIAAFVCYERFYAPHPLLPFVLLKRKTVIGCVLIALFHPVAGRIVSGYLYTFLLVAADQSVLSATRITSFPTVAGTVTAMIGALLSSRFRMLKPIIILGFVMELLSMGLMIRYRRSTNSQGELAVVQLLRGAANGFIPYPTQALIQAAAPHEHLAAITAGWLVVYYLAGGIGSAIGGAMWTNIVPNKLQNYLNGDDALITAAYGNPIGYATKYAVGTFERDALVRAQDEAQRTIVIVGTCISVLSLLTSLFLIDNLRLPDTQSIEETEKVVEDAEKERRGKVAVPEVN
ncbi:hypothetical protein L202_03381 [Cryptococcus amylolentus CBS 6039]|uniref:Major facilitator superfamily (MFS) profile domain-containing protein n=1 Tax=Cryptococcus amylolentus CBS 6039 TaxID=1295533 RepID=A0A1E3HSP2_9TREE|nr:hypothetical protein L202_03381 [Cryptococcus amylolentus CBS 6039]ODN79379.1 hypothetical protein L202_03381 [Cryptococcus amylolentus CBS 6039]